jgi:nucleoside-diphosphate-sugar epimerase
MTVLVTGASGFIGKILLHRNQHFDGIDKYVSDSNVMECNVLDTSNFGEIIQSRNIDTIVHLAGVQYTEYIKPKNRYSFFDENVKMAEKIVELSILNNIKKIIYVSTLQVYGTNLVGDYSENSQIILDGAYSYNHYCGELLCQLYSRRNKLSATIIRPANVYGKNHIRPFSRDTLVPECFVKELFSTGVIRLNSSGKQIRNFINVLDVAAQIEQALDENSDHDFLVQNACSSTYMSIADVAQQDSLCRMQAPGS